MARRRRRKPWFRFRFLPYLIAFVLVAVISGLCYAVWLAQPSFLRQLRTKTGDLLTRQPRTKQDRREEPERKSSESPRSRVSSDENGRLKKEAERLKAENADLRLEINRLRNELQRTSEALVQKNTEIDDLKLRLLIRQKTSARSP